MGRHQCIRAVCRAVYMFCLPGAGGTAVLNPHCVVGKKGVIGRYINQSPLKNVLIPGNLVPPPHISFYIKILYSSFMASLWGNVSCIHSFFLQKQTMQRIGSHYCCFPYSSPIISFMFIVPTISHTSAAPSFEMSIRYSLLASPQGALNTDTFCPSRFITDICS